MADYSYQTTITYKGRRFCPDGKGYYYNSSIRKRLHQCIWEDANGPVPKGYQIHHIDGNKDNNDLSNLTCISAKEHRKLHFDQMSEEQQNRVRRNMEENARPAAIEWHKSDAGKDWHSIHSRQQWENHAFDRELICSNCGKSFIGHLAKKGGNTFCSNACKSAYRRKMKVDCVPRICPICGKQFLASKFDKREVITCSRSCGNRLWHRKKKETQSC